MLFLRKSLLTFFIGYLTELLKKSLQISLQIYLLGCCVRNTTFHLFSDPEYNKKLFEDPVSCADLILFICGIVLQ